jgi:hypothetical protein
MARRAHAYPQVTLTAGDVIDTEVLAAPQNVTAADALRFARRGRARVLACGARHYVLTDDLARAESLGLGDLMARDVARPLPIVDARTPELAVRRHLAEGVPVVIVAGKGAVARAAAPRALSVRARLEKALSPRTREMLASVARVAAAQGARAFVAGGLVASAAGALLLALAPSPALLVVGRALSGGAAACWVALLVLAVGGWTVDGLRWALAAPLRPRPAAA